MSKHNNFKKQIDKCLDQVPVSAINSNEILLRLIVQELAVIADGIGRLGNFDYNVSVDDDPMEDDGK